MQTLPSHGSEELPDVTVVVLNWNGMRFLGRCLTALLQTTYPRDRFTVILADNASTDGSPDWVRAHFPQVQILETGGNLGFGGGNNRAIQASTSPFVALLNSDTAVQPDWLLHLVRPLQSDATVGATTARLLYMHDFLPLKLRCDSFTPSEEMNSGDTRTLGVQVYGAELANGNHREGQEVRRLAGFHPPERDGEGRSLQWSGATAELGVPLAHRGSTGINLTLELAAWRPDQRTVRVSLLCAGRLLFAGAVDGEPREIRINLPDSLRLHAKPLLQSAGSCILPDGSGRDRGTIVNRGHVYPPWDDGAFDAAAEVFHFNGAACLLRRDMLAAVGLFDERFFMYYEDMDLAWRARAQGWRVLYVPQAIVRHVHSGSAGEWSPLFTYNVDLNRLLMLLKNAPRRLARQQVARYAAETIGNSVHALWGLLVRAAGTRGQLSRLWIRLQVWLRLLLLTPGLLRDRHDIQAGRSVSQQDIGRWLQSREE